MARIFIDGFEAGDLKLWDSNTGASAVAAAVGMDGSYCLEVTGSSDSIQKSLPADDEYYFAFKYRYITDAVLSLLTLLKGSTTIGRVVLVSGVLRVYAGTTLLATGSAPISLNTTYLIEVRYKIADSGGVVQVKVNGVLDIDFSGDTKPGTDTQMDQMRLGYWTTTPAGYGYAYYDNVIVDDAAWPGNTRIQAIVPTGAGASTQWAPSAGTNWQCVDEKPASELDFVSTNTISHLDTYASGDLVGSIENIKCVQLQALAVKEGAPTPLNLQVAVKSGVTTYFSSDKAVPATTSKGLAALWETDPATAAAWEIAAVNAAEIGMKAVA